MSLLHVWQKKSLGRSIGFSDEALFNNPRFGANLAANNRIIVFLAAKQGE
jgi:hypothetical protein